jgi:hypothetical protein
LSIKGLGLGNIPLTWWKWIHSVFRIGTFKTLFQTLRWYQLTDNGTSCLMPGTSSGSQSQWHTTSTACCKLPGSMLQFLLTVKHLLMTTQFVRSTFHVCASYYKESQHTTLHTCYRFSNLSPFVGAWFRWWVQKVVCMAPVVPACHWEDNGGGEDTRISLSAGMRISNRADLTR